MKEARSPLLKVSFTLPKQFLIGVAVSDTSFTPIEVHFFLLVIVFTLLIPYRRDKNWSIDLRQDSSPVLDLVATFLGGEKVVRYSVFDYGDVWGWDFDELHQAEHFSQLAQAYGFEVSEVTENYPF
jgi:hypothetical protein